MKSSEKRQSIQKEEGLKFTQAETDLLIAGLDALKAEANKVGKLAKDRGIDGAFKEAEKRYLFIEEIKQKLL